MSRASKVSRRTFAGAAIAVAGGAALPKAASAQAECKPAIPPGSGVWVPGRWIPVPETISPQAQAFLNAAGKLSANVGNPPSDPNDKEAWRAYIAKGDAQLTAMLSKNLTAHPAEIIEHQLSATKIYEIVPKSLSPKSLDKVIYSIHGGAYINAAGMGGVYMGMPMASTMGLRAFSVNYRMPPDHPFPTGLNDAVEGYKWLLTRYKAKNIVIAGGSAGGGLSASLVLKIRDLGLPMPGCCALGTPEADLTETGDSFETLDTIDVVSQHRLTPSVQLYAGGHDLRDPYLSAVFGDFSKGYPPTILTTGTRDIFLSNTVRLHRALRKSGIDAELHVWEAMPHGGFFGAPEDAELGAEQARFIRKHLKIA